MFAWFEDPSAAYLTQEDYTVSESNTLVLHLWEFSTGVHPYKSHGTLTKEERYQSEDMPAQGA